MTDKIIDIFRENRPKRRVRFLVKYTSTRTGLKNVGQIVSKTKLKKLEKQNLPDFRIDEVIVD